MSINRSHNEADGGILLFSGELILLFCDSVQCEIGGKESVKGRVYLTTHRLVMIVSPYRQNSAVKSLCAPFCAITKCNVEQPVFGANYIEATVRDENDPSRSFSFKLRFSKGGAIEFAMAMNRAVAAVGRNHNASMPPPPAYTPTPGAQYYQAPPTVYAPGYNCGVQMPVQQFPDQPPIGFIYASSAPPPYPGLGTAGQPNQGPPTYSQQQQSGGYPSQQQGYPGQQQPGYSGQQQQGYPGQQQPGYPGQQQPGYPGQQSGYPGQTTPAQPQGGGGAYPGYSQPAQQQASAGYPSQPQNPYAPPQQPVGYPQQTSNSSASYPAQPSSAGYPDLNTISGGSGNQSSSENAWPTAPSFNPNWQEDKKSN